MADLLLELPRDHGEGPGETGRGAVHRRRGDLPIQEQQEHGDKPALISFARFQPEKGNLQP